jgi:hypothetical protein
MTKGLRRTSGAGAAPPYTNGPYVSLCDGTGVPKVEKVKKK